MIQKLSRFIIAVSASMVFLATGCAAQQTEEQALLSLRNLTNTGKLPPEGVVADIESRFGGKKTGALAKLLRARIRFDSGDYAGASAMLNSDVFGKKTKVADHALWLRIKALEAAGNHSEALSVSATLIREHAFSVRHREARLAWARAAIKTGRAVEVPPMLVDLAEAGDKDALLQTALAFHEQGSRSEAAKYFRRALYVSAPKLDGKSEIEQQATVLGYMDLRPTSAAEHLMRAEGYFKAKNYGQAADSYRAATGDARFEAKHRIRMLTALANSGRVAEAQSEFGSLAQADREEGYRQLVLGYDKARQWAQVRSTADAMKSAFPSGTLVAKTLIDAGLAARDAKNRLDESYFFSTALTSYPNAVEVAQAQFELAWAMHEQKSFPAASQMLIEHLARYADKDTTNRGKAGYWAARDSERAGKMAEACALHDGMIYRYGANWYGYLSMNRLTALKNSGQCRSVEPPNSTVAKAVANLKTITVAAETAGEGELERTEKSEELSIVGLFDWAIDELNEAKKTAGNSPKINLALAKHYRLKGDQVNALLSLGKSYPDYAQMFPEEMGRDEWDIFYPLTNWNEIVKWSRVRGLDRYQVAGIIRQETIFDPDAKSHANAYGLMQLLLPTAQSMARKYSAGVVPTSPAQLYNPDLNIELGTAYMKDQFDKFGRFEYVGIAYNAGPGRVNPWRAQLPLEMDEFVEAIPFKETKGYVQGIIRNSAQYRRLYDDNGNFRSNVGTKALRGEIDSKPRERVVSENLDLIVDDNGE